MELDLHVTRFDWPDEPAPGSASQDGDHPGRGLGGGRAELGIGAAWYEREHVGLDVPFPPTAERFERLEEALNICLQMWSPENGPFEGRYYRLAETLCHPAPVSEPWPRILIGGSGERKTLRLVADYADACNFLGFGGPVEIAQKLAVLRRHCDKVDRDPADIEVTATACSPMTGARMQTTMLNSLEWHDKSTGLITMCVGGGQGSHPGTAVSRVRSPSAHQPALGLVPEFGAEVPPHVLDEPAQRLPGAVDQRHHALSWPAAL